MGRSIYNCANCCTRIYKSWYKAGQSDKRAAQPPISQDQQQCRRTAAMHSSTATLTLGAQPNQSGCAAADQGNTLRMQGIQPQQNQASATPKHVHSCCKVRKNVSLGWLKLQAMLGMHKTAAACHTLQNVWASVHILHTHSPAASQHTSHWCARE